MRRFFLLTVSLLIFIGCGVKKPTDYEGNASLEVRVTNNSGEFISQAEVYWISNFGERGEAQLTDSLGTVFFSNLSSGQYTVFAKKSMDEKIYYSGNSKINIRSSGHHKTTIQVRLNTAGLKINEIFYAGFMNNSYYFKDQFIELYNGGIDTAYLDGTLFIRCGGDALAGKDNDNDGDLDFIYFDVQQGEEHRCIWYVFQLPGDPVNGRKYPIAPGEYAVVACDAIDHRIYESNSIDLSDAEYEFYNPLFMDDPKNPNVPDYLNIIMGEYCKPVTSDFSLGTKGDIVFLASGLDSIYWDGIDINTIIDGVEYISNKDGVQRLDDSIDKGVAGIEFDKIVTKFSGMSIQRIYPGFDTNNSTVDFYILDQPTPGY